MEQDSYEASSSLDDSMLDIIDRAEAFLSAHSALINQNSEVQREEMSQLCRIDYGPLPTHEEVIIESDDSSDTICYEVETVADSQVARATSENSDIAVVDTVPNRISHAETIDLCNSPVMVEDYHRIVESTSRPRTRQRRRRFSDVPVVDVICLDDTISTNTEENSAAPAKRASIQNPVAQNQTQNHVPENGGSTGRNIICPICFDSIINAKAASTMCGHLFCYPCICAEINIRKKCPLCKKKLTRAQVHPIYFN